MLTRDQLTRRIPPNIRASLGPLELKARVDLAEDILSEAEHLPDAKAKKGRAFVDEMLDSLSFMAFLRISRVLIAAIEAAASDAERETYRNELAELARVQPVLLLAGDGEDIAPILAEIAGEQPKRRWWHRLMFWK
jgi:hypothetical protein